MSLLNKSSAEVVEKREYSQLDLLDALKTVREGVVAVDENMRIVGSNDAAINMFAHSDGSLKGKRVSEVVRDVSVHDALAKVLSEGDASKIKLEILLPEKKTYEVNVTPLELNSARHAIAVFYDLTQIEHLENVRQEFLSNISHELRTPLTSIMAFVETLENSAIDNEANNRRFLSVIRKNVKRMHHLINDISELSSIEAGTIRIEIEKLPLSNLIKEVFASLSAKAEQRNILLKNEVPENVKVTADIIRLEQMMTNLIDNAIKFNRENGVVTVRHERRESMDVISIIDTGEGILKEHTSRVFERFYRIDRARSREIGGTGLGLAIVKHLVRIHGGRLEVDSTPGKSATFIIKLPVNSITT